nr:ATP synthase F0 subunit 8 [Microcosmus sp. z YZ-2024]
MPQLNFSTFFVIFLLMMTGFFIFKWSGGDVGGLK